MGARLFFSSTIMVLFVFENHAFAQSIKLLEKLVEAMGRREGQTVARELAQQGAIGLERRIVLQESEEAAAILSRRLAPATEDSLLKRFNRLQGVNDSLRADYRALSAAERQLVVELGEGAQHVLRRYPTVGLDLIGHLDSSGIAQVRTYGEFVLDGAHWLHSDDVMKVLRTANLSSEESAAISKLLKLKSLDAIAPEHVAPLWKSVIRKTGDGAGIFWKTYVSPHRGKWLATGIIATYLAMPEKFHDAAGNLTEYAVRKLSELGVSVVVGAGRGLIRGPINAFNKHYADDPTGTILALFFVGCLIILAIPPCRRFIWQHVFGRFWKSPPQATAPTLPNYEPLRER